MERREERTGEERKGQQCRRDCPAHDATQHALEGDLEGLLQGELERVVDSALKVINADPQSKADRLGQTWSD